MKSNYSILITEKDPIVYLEHSVICMNDGMLTAINDKGFKKRLHPGTTLCLFLGAGTSITQSAGIFAATHDMYIFMGRGGCFIHSMWHSNRWQNPITLINQSKLHSCKKKRLRIAKKLIDLKFRKEEAHDSFRSQLDNVKDIKNLLTLEARWARQLYKQEALLVKQDFKRDQDSKKGINGSLSMLNNGLYTFSTAIIYAFGFHPSIGFIHGQSRRGGLAFDLADIFKYELSIKPSFREIEYKTTKEMIGIFSNKLKNRNRRLIREMIHVLRYINGDVDEEAVEDILDEYSRI